jgi:hypothetical protein
MQTGTTHNILVEETKGKWEDNIGMNNGRI